MDRPENPQDDKPGTHNVPALIHDYRAQREAWREQARNLARMREEVLTAADREARDIVSAARADVRRILLKARRDLLVLAAQVRAAGRPISTEDSPEAINLLPADDLRQVGNALTTARLDVRRVLDESRPELEGLASEGEALRAALRHHPVPSTPIDVRTRITTTPDDSPYTVPTDAPVGDPPLDFDFSSTREDNTSDLTITRVRRPVRAFVVAAATLGSLALMGTGWWLYRPSPDEAAKKVTKSGSPSTATTAAPAEKRTAATATGAAARSPIPESRSPLSVQLALKGTSWVRVTADGRVTAERVFKAGETQRVNATKEVSIRAGDAGVVTVSVDGRQPVALGREGEVVTRRFAVETPRSQPAAPVPTRPTTNPGVPVAQSVAKQPATTAAAPLRLPAPSPSSTPLVRPTEQAVTTTPPVTAAAPPAAVSAPPPASTAAPTNAAAAANRPPAPMTPAPPVQASLQDSLTTVASRWLDAYYRQDRATMTAISAKVNVSDDRGQNERLPRGLNEVRRSLEDVNFQQVGSEAIITARMTERMDDASAGKMAQAVSFVAHMFTQRNGAWQLYDVRIVSASSLSQSLRR